MVPVVYRALVGLNLPCADGECRVEPGELVPAECVKQVPKDWLERGIVEKLKKGDN